MSKVEYVSLGRPKGSRNKRTTEIFNRLEERGDLDPVDFLSSIVTNNNEPKELRIQAAGLVIPYKYSRMGSAPPTRYIEQEIEVPEFTSVDVAEQFLAKITTLLAAGQLDLDFADSLTKTTVGWIQSQYAKQGIDLKAQAQGSGAGEQTIRILGGLEPLPGTNISMPPREIINGKSTYDLLEHGNPSSIDGVHTAEPPATNVAKSATNVAPEPDPT
jgi:hypothetical protein